ncbi:MAG TPA: hypothetical protein VGB17_17600 [Pyrinomonadaceae bacterium]|jgi:hypothetical protein
MRWSKRGLVHVPEGNSWWAKSYAFNPTAEVVDEQTLRVYFASLDENHYGRVGYVELDARNPQRVLAQAAEPVLELGELGTFDDSGVNPSCLIHVGARSYLYYIGWQRCERVPYMLFTGLAVRGEGESLFRKHSRVPVLDRTGDEPFSRSALCVVQENEIFKGWYWSCEEWSRDESWVHYNNVIRYTESSDGIVWTNPGRICISPAGPDDYAVGRPWVIKDGELYKMWYSIRSRAQLSYRMGYAESADGLDWTRKDEEVGIGPSESGWDSEMLCCPCVVDAGGRRYMFYNGNRHGQTGFGYAVLESE